MKFLGDLRLIRTKKFCSGGWKAGVYLIVSAQPISKASDYGKIYYMLHPSCQRQRVKRIRDRMIEFVEDFEEVKMQVKDEKLFKRIIKNYPQKQFMKRDLLLVKPAYTGCEIKFPILVFENATPAQWSPYTGLEKSHYLIWSPATDTNNAKYKFNPPYISKTDVISVNEADAVLEILGKDHPQLNRVICSLTADGRTISVDVANAFPGLRQLIKSQQEQFFDGQAVLAQGQDLMQGRGVQVRAPHDPVNSPSHYTQGGIETIDFIEAKKLNYNLGNVVKYITRAGQKDQSKWIEDLQKAAWYLNREIENLKKANAQS